MSRLTLPGKTTPTWEVELLISGAVVISLFQLLGPMEAWFAKWVMLAPGDREAFVIYSYFYGKVAVLVLIVTFVLHIAARATWVALVGLNSIYPGGPKWENLAGGPIGRRVAQRLTGDMDEAIERADNRASLVFGYGILAAQFSLMTLVLTLLFVGLSMLLGLVLPPWIAVVSAAAVLFGPLVLTAVADKLLGARLDPQGRGARLVASGIRLGMGLTFARLTSPLMPLVTTNVGGKRGTWVLVGVLYLAIAVAGLDTFAQMGVMEVMRGDGMPETTRSRGANALHYAARRDERQRHAPLPYIPDEVVEGPYLRLFVPYVADRHDVPLARECGTEQQALSALPEAPDEASVRAEGQAAVDRLDAEQRVAEEALMACFAQLMDIRLDGRPLAGLRLERHRDAYSGHDGGLAMIDVRALPAGRHELRVRRWPQAAGGLKTSDGAPQPPDRILFWR